MTEYAPTTQVAPDATLKPEDVIEVLRQCFDPEIPVNIVDLGLIYDIAIKPERVDIKMTLTALGCPMAADVMSDVRDHLLTLPGVQDAGVDIVYDPVVRRRALGTGDGLDRTLRQAACGHTSQTALITD